MSAANFNSNYAIIAPFHNEENHLDEFIGQLIKSGPHDIYLVDDGSTDRSLAIAETFRPQVKINHLPKNIGQGNAIFQTAQHLPPDYSHFLSIDTDLQHRPSEISNLKNALTHAPYDIVVGNRYDPASSFSGTQPQLRYTANQLFCDLFNAAYDVDISDCFSGFMLFNRTSFQSLRPFSSDYFWVFELWHYILKNNLNFVEVPITRIYIDQTRNFNGRYTSYTDILTQALLEFFRHIDPKKKLKTKEFSVHLLRKQYEAELHASNIDIEKIHDHIHTVL